MKSQRLKRLGLLLRMRQKVLKRQAQVSYYALLSKLCLHHLEDFPEIGPFYTCLRRRDLPGLVAQADFLSSQKYEDARKHYLANQFAALVRKYPFDPRRVKTDPESQAIKTFIQSERKCSRMNTIFKIFERRSPYELYLSRIRGFTRFVLGDSPDVDGIFNKCSFGAGASVGVHGNATHVAKKISGTLSVSPGAFTLGFNALVANPHLKFLFLENRGGFHCYDKDYAYQKYWSRTSIVTYNKISFVPKTVRTHRTIAVEPVVNGYLQKGVDEVMRKALLRIGIDLGDQTKNQRMARAGSLDDSDDSFVTIDLSSASDSISIGLVRNVLPPDWVYLLDSIRSKNYVLPDGTISAYSKFCSMGNGFCFPLETLLFTAVCASCDCGIPGDDFSVYGDDIIVRKRYANRVIWLLKKLGFTTNKRKTFIEGPFRESCGEDWFGGASVRPFTLDYKLDSIESIFKILNVSKERSSSEQFFKIVRPHLLGLLPPDLRFLRPFKGNHDSGIDGYDDEFLSSGNCRLNKAKQIWEWTELEHRPVEDTSPIAAGTDETSVWMYCLLSGMTSSRSSKRLPVSCFLRRKTRTTMVLTGHSGATSLWLPTAKF